MVVALGALLGCTGPHPPDMMQPAPEHDPLERINRKIFWFNDKVDVYGLEPVATGWNKIAPERVQRSISNFFQNLRFPIIAINDLLQGKALASASDVGRFGVNTTVGVLGLFDPASSWGLEKHVEDLGQTFAWWGLPSGPYLVLPFLGPSNVRDAVGLAGDYAFSVTPFFVDEVYIVGAQIVDTVNTRSLLLEQIRNAKQASFDYYVFVRNAYAQHRAALIADKVEGATTNEEELYYPNTELEQQP